MECKNSKDYDLPVNGEKRRLGAFLEKRSGSKSLFAIPKGNDFEAIMRGWESNGKTN